MAATTSMGLSMMLNSTSFSEAPFSFLPKKYKEVNTNGDCRWDPLFMSLSQVLHPTQQNIVLNHGWHSYITCICSLGENQTQDMIKKSNESLKIWYWCSVCTHCKRFIQTNEERLEHTRQIEVFASCNTYFQVTTKTCNMNSWYQDECTGNVQYQNCADVIESWAMYVWIWGAKTERKVAMPWFPSLTIITHLIKIESFFYEINESRGVTFCWFDQKHSNTQLNNVQQHPPFIWTSGQTNIDGINGYFCCLVDEDGPCSGKYAAVTNHQMQSLPSSLMNSHQSKEEELFKCITWKSLMF